MKPYKSGLPLVSDFENLIDSLPGRIKIAKLTTREVCKVSLIPRPTYYKQLKARSFTAAEVKRLLRTIAKLSKRFKSVEDDDLAEPVALDQEPPAGSVEVGGVWLTNEERLLFSKLEDERYESHSGKPLDPSVVFAEVLAQIVAQRAGKGD